MSNLPELKIRIGADGSAVGPGVSKAKGELDKLDVAMAKMGRGAAKAAKAAAAGMAAVGAAALAAGISAGEMAVSIQNAARSANTDTTTFQKWAAAARTVGVEQDKLGDILKDVTDRVGEFLSTGSGPMADFFENIAPRVGVTAEQFANLSGPEALQLYVDSLQKAGVNQQQMTFYLEAMSGDLSRLMPLLKNGGTEMRRLGDAAEDAGQIMSKEMIDGGVEMNRIFAEIGATLKTSATKAVLEHKDELIKLANFVSDTAIPALGDLVSVVGGMAEALAPAIASWAEFGRRVAFVVGLTEGGRAMEGNATEKQDLAEFNNSQMEPSTTGTWPLDADGNVILDDGGPPLVTKVTTPAVLPFVPPASGSGSSKGGGGGGQDRAARDLERLQEQYASEREALDLHLQEQLDQLAEFREKKLAGEQELADLEEKIRTDHAEKMRQVDQISLRERLDAWSGAFGDLSALMNTENKKLFNIGKAAAIAQAVVDGWSAATSAWDKGMKIGGPPTAAAFAAFSLARTGAMISSLASTQIGSGSGAASSAGGAGSAGAGAAAQPARTANYVIHGDTIGRQTGGELIKSINEAIRDGYQINLEWA